MTTPDRNAIVDTLRTAALIGICVVNLPYMALPASQTLTQTPTGPDQFAAIVTAVFFEAKFFILFSFLFGWGMQVQYCAAERAGVDASRRHWRRMIMLAVFGVLHAVLVFSGDILLLYSLVGSLIWPLRRASPKRLLGFALGMIALSLLCLFLISLVIALSPTAPADPTPDCPRLSRHDQGACSRLAGDLRLPDPVPGPLGRQRLPLRSRHGKARHARSASDALATAVRDRPARACADRAALEHRLCPGRERSGSGMGSDC